MTTGRRRFPVGAAWWLALAAAVPGAASAEVTTDGTLGPQVSLSGSNIEIGADLGQQRGGNLFHSFRKLDVATGGRVAFTGPDSVRNVIGRVTGGERSEIDGTLASTIPDANLYLINPAGILFGPNAKLDVKGSFHASTAAELRMADGAVFSALDTAGSTLSVAEPRAFGFLGAPPGAITVNASLLEVGDAKALSLVGGDVLINGDGNGRVNDSILDDSRLDGQADKPGTVRAPGGRMTLAALGGAGELGLTDGAVTGAASGTVALSREASAVASGDGGGSIALSGGRILISGGSLVIADNLGDGPASGVVSVAASELLDIRDAGQLRSSSVGEGRGGNVLIATPSLVIDGLNTSSLITSDPRAGIFVRAEQRSGGDAGALVINARDIELTNRAVIVGPTSGVGRAADLTLNASGLFRVADSRIAVSADDMAAARANAGSITITAGAFELLDGASVLAVAENREGNGGSLRVRAERGLTIAGGRIAADTRGAGGAGRVDVLGQAIELRNGGRIESRSRGRSGGDGAVSVRAAESLLIDRGTIRTDTVRDGNAGNVLVSSPRITLRNGSITSETEGGIGNAGTVQIDAESLGIINGEISTQASSARGLRGASGNAGRIIVRAADIELRESGRIRSTTTGSGEAGEILITANSLAIENRTGDLAAISAGTDGSGGGGRVLVRAQDVTIVGAQASIAATARGRGNAGGVDIETVRLTVSDGGRIASQASIDETSPSRVLTGNAGSVVVRAEEVALRDGGRILVRTQGPGDGGRVEIAADRIVIGGDFAARDEVIRSGITATADQGSSGRGGSVLVRGGDIALNTGGAITSSTAGTNDAGGVRVAATRSLGIDGGTIESSSTGTGRGGNVRIAAPTAQVSLSGGGTVAASAEAGAGAGNVVVEAQTLAAQGGIVSTSGGDTAGGRITVNARRRIVLRDTAITASGEFPDAEGGASVITISAPEIVLSRSQVEAFTGDGTPLAGSGEATIKGRPTVISADSRVEASSAVVISGLQTNLGSDLQLAPGTFLDASGLLRPSCAERGAVRSTFSRGGRGGLPPSPDRPLPSAGAGGSVAGKSVTAARVMLDACAGTLVPEARS